MKTALITGVTGQDGSYLAELLLTESLKPQSLFMDENDMYAEVDAEMVYEILQSNLGDFDEFAKYIARYIS